MLNVVSILAGIALAPTTALPIATQGEEWALKTADGKAALYVSERGKGSRAIILHGGFGSDSSYMFDISNGLENAHRFVFYDQRGSLRSPCNPTDVSFAKHVEDLEALQSELGEEKITLIAHSAGTLLACAYFQKHPDKVKNLILIGLAQPKSRFANADFPAGKPPVEWGPYSKAINAFNSRPEIENEITKNGLGKEKLTSKERTDLWRINYAGANLYHVERWREMRGLSHFFNVAAAKACNDLFSTEYDFLPALKATKIPITIIEGTHDFCDFGGVIYKNLFSDKPMIKTVVLKDAGHMMWIDDRAGFRKELDTALRR